MAIKARHTFRGMLVVLMACLVVVLIPSEAWANTVPAGWTVSPYYFGLSGPVTLVSLSSVTYNTGSTVEVHSVVWSDSGASSAYQYCAPVGYGMPTMANLEWHRSSSAPGTSAWAYDSSIIDASVSGTSGTITCYSGYRLVGLYVFEYPTGGGQASVILPGAPPPASSCSTGTGFDSVSAGYVSGVLTVVVAWHGTLPAAPGFRVWVPGDAFLPSGTATSYVPVVGTSTPGQYLGTATVSGLTVGDGVRVDVAASTGCYILGTLGSAAAVLDTAGNGTTSSGADCGLNPFCYFGAALKAAFYPTTDMTVAWSSRLTTVEAHPPLNFALAAVGLFTAITTDTTCGVGTGYSGSCSGSFSAPSAFDTGLGATFDPLSAAAAMFHGGTDTSGWGPRVWIFMEIGVWIPPVVWMYRRIARSFGGKS